MQALLKIIGSECTVINRELGAKSVQRCWNRAAQYSYLYLQGLVCSPDLNVCVFATVPYAARAQVRSKGMAKVLQLKATVWPKVASEST